MNHRRARNSPPYIPRSGARQASLNPSWSGARPSTPHRQPPRPAGHPHPRPVSATCRDPLPARRTRAAPIGHVLIADLGQRVIGAQQPGLAGVGAAVGEPLTRLPGVQQSAGQPAGTDHIWCGLPRFFRPAHISNLPSPAKAAAESGEPVFAGHGQFRGYPRRMPVPSGNCLSRQPQNVHLQRPPRHLQTHPTRYAPRLLPRSRPQRRTQRPARVRRVSHGRTEPDPARDNSHPAPLRLPAY